MKPKKPQSESVTNMLKITRLNVEGAVLTRPEKPMSVGARTAVPLEDPLESLQAAVSLDPKDWSAKPRDAWVYGIICGWESGLDEVAAIHCWTAEDVARLRRLRQKFESMGSTNLLQKERP